MPYTTIFRSLDLGGKVHIGHDINIALYNTKFLLYKNNFEADNSINNFFDFTEEALINLQKQCKMLPSSDEINSKIKVPFLSVNETDYNTIKTELNNI